MNSLKLAIIEVDLAHKNKDNTSPYKARRNERKSTAHGEHKAPGRIYSFAEADERIHDIFCNHGLADFPHEQRMQLSRFYGLLMENQKKENFTRLLTLKDVAIKHFIDCIWITKLTNLRFPLLDVGTGPGFPGIPLKILFPQDKIILAEGVQKRVEFLKQVRDQLGLKNLDIIGRNINNEFVYPTQGVITRAVEDIRNTLGNVIGSLQTGGFVYFMKGPSVDPEIDQAQKIWHEHYQLMQDIPYVLPQTPHERRLLIYQKIKGIN